MTEAQEKRYLDLNDSYYGGPDDGVIEFRRVRIGKTRKPHECHGNGPGEAHEIPVGSTVVMDTAKYDGSVGTDYTCLPCLDRWAKECHYDRR